MNWEGGLSIDELLGVLRDFDPEASLSPGFDEAMSYRGYYECLGLQPSPSATVREMMAVLLEAKGATYSGYKGGDYTMDGDTECFLAAYGRTGVPITREWVDLTWKVRPELTELHGRVAELEAEVELHMNGAARIASRAQKAEAQRDRLVEALDALNAAARKSVFPEAVRLAIRGEDWRSLWESIHGAEDALAELEEER